MFVSFVALGEGATLYASRLQSALRRGERRRLASAEVSWDDDRTILTVSADGESVLVAPMEAPSPGFAESCARAPFWPSDAPTEHARHVILTLVSDGHPLEQAILLTDVTEALVQTCGQPVGVMWVSSGVILPPAAFLEMAERFREGEPLDRFWVGYDVRARGPERGDGRTKGLADFGLLDLEASDAPESARELLRRLNGLASYLLTNGPVIEDGDTIGESEDEKIRIVYGPSPFDGGGDDDVEVMRLEYGDGGIEEF